MSFTSAAELARGVLAAEIILGIIFLSGRIIFQSTFHIYKQISFSSVSCQSTRALALKLLTQQNAQNGFDGGTEIRQDQEVD